ncbi:MAG TPA: outer membrane beta-barrel protein [Steroidobacteraceae bacterium]|nr:outer membrane beta-barrel protein [Steroidobacteraceae bacterium]
MRKTLAIPALAALGLAGPVLAGDFSYNTLELGLIGDSIDDPHGSEDLDGSGISVSGSWALSPNLFAFGGVSGTDYEYRHYDDNFNASQWQAGVGFNFPLSPQLDLVSGISLQHLRLDNDRDELDESGYGLKAGLRGLLGRRLEWTAGLNYVDYGNGDNDTSWTAGFRYYFTRLFAVGVDVGSTDSNEANVLLAFRWDFGNRR